MIGMQEQFGRIAERFVRREPFRIGMPVGRDDGQTGNFAIQLARDRSHPRIGRKKPVGV